jgi:hypothetical protein
MDPRLTVNVKEVPLLGMIGWLLSILVRIAEVVIDAVLWVVDRAVYFIESVYGFLINGVQATFPLSLGFVLVFWFMAFMAFSLVMFFVHSVLGMSLIPLTGDGVHYPDRATEVMVKSMQGWMLFLFVMALVCALHG